MDAFWRFAFSRSPCACVRGGAQKMRTTKNGGPLKQRLLRLLAYESFSYFMLLSSHVSPPTMFTSAFFPYHVCTSHGGVEHQYSAISRHKAVKQVRPIRARQRKQADRDGDSQHVVEHLYSTQFSKRRNRNLPGLL